MNRFKLALECPSCGEIIEGDVMVDFTVPEGVVLLNSFEQQEFYCNACGTTVYTGDVDSFCEYEECDYDSNDADEYNEEQYEEEDE